jgi:hypothetical protein
MDKQQILARVGNPAFYTWRFFRVINAEVVSCGRLGRRFHSAGWRYLRGAGGTIRAGWTTQIETRLRKAAAM